MEDIAAIGEDLPKDLGIKVIEGSVNEQPYADGIILRKILLYRREGNEALENKWWARLSTTKQKDLKQLLKKPLFMNALNELLDMPGLWYPIKLGTLHRLLTLRCDEVGGFGAEKNNGLFIVGALTVSTTCAHSMVVNPSMWRGSSICRSR
ncbi:hypothetical protein MPH_08985 [Macrophomina phaseolina MS6]|uniref:Uncharacterized protein n=1 Tax=Macrophomina phaseolina (strain MS6) TaxID=1126212 RepID=K2RGY4_MACPH|nr:hypothetical protein MPH_08985 [Macrophomina phaseolina MS6]